MNTPDGLSEAREQLAKAASKTRPAVALLAQAAARAAITNNNRARPAHNRSCQDGGNCPARC